MSAGGVPCDQFPPRSTWFGPELGVGVARVYVPVPPRLTANGLPAVRAVPVTTAPVTSHVTSATFGSVDAASSAWIAAATVEVVIPEPAVYATSDPPTVVLNVCAAVALPTVSVTTCDTGPS